MRRFALVGVLFATLTTIAAGAPPSEVADLTVTRSGNTLTVTGAATFGNASSVQVGTDPAADVAYAGIGADITGVHIARVGPNLRFRLDIADPMPEVFTLPEFTHYHWSITVTNGEQLTHYLLQAMRSGQYDRTIPGVDPLFRVNSCGSLSSGAPSCFNHKAFVDGVMANGAVEWVVPLDTIGAREGSVIADGPNAIEIEGGASGAVYGTPSLDRATTTPYVVGPAVLVSIVGTSSTVTTEVASLGPDGTFVAKLAMPSFGSGYSVRAVACHGLASACGERSSGIPTSG